MEIGRMVLIIIAAIALLLTPLFSSADTEGVVAEKDPGVESMQNNQITEEEESVDGTFLSISDTHVKKT